jgi:hypothetical protein
MKKRLFEVEMHGVGAGEWTAGVVTDSELIEALKIANENGDLNFTTELEEPIGEYNTYEIECIDYIDILNVYGLNIAADVDITVRELKIGKDGEAEISDESYLPIYLNDDIVWKGTDREVAVATLDTPYIDSEYIKNEYGEDALILLGLNSEENAICSFVVETNGENFDYKNLLIGTILMDEISDYQDDIIAEVFYFDYETLKKEIKNIVNENKENEKLVTKINLISKGFEDALKKDFSENISVFINEYVMLLKESLDIHQSISSVSKIMEFLPTELYRLQELEGSPNFAEARLFDIDGEPL